VLEPQQAPISVRRHINWNNQRADLKEDLAASVVDYYSGVLTSDVIAPDILVPPLRFRLFGLHRNQYWQPSLLQGAISDQVGTNTHIISVSSIRCRKGPAFVNSVLESYP